MGWVLTAGLLAVSAVAAPWLPPDALAVAYALEDEKLVRVKNIGQRGDVYR